LLKGGCYSFGYDSSKAPFRVRRVAFLGLNFDMDTPSGNPRWFLRGLDLDDEQEVEIFDLEHIEASSIQQIVRP
jgi:hypothetical protein